MNACEGVSKIKREKKKNRNYPDILNQMLKYIDNDRILKQIKQD